MSERNGEVAVPYEHDSIDRGLMLSGLRLGAGSPDLSQLVVSVPVLFLAWSPREWLLRSPKWAWLSVPDIKFVRLPQPAEALKALIEASGRTLDASPQVLVLTHPVGQFRWAVGQLEAARVKERNKEVRLRIRELHLFANQHWPGWFDGVLTKVEAGIAANDIDRTRIAIGRMKAKVADVAVASSVSALFHGGNQDLVNKGAGAAKAAIGAVRGGLADISYLRSVLSSTQWPGSVKSTLGQAIDLVRSLEAIDHAPSFGISDPAKRAAEAMSRVEHFAKDMLQAATLLADGVPRPDDDFSSALLSAERDLATLMQSVNQLREERDRMKRELDCGIKDQAADSVR